jgi:hypothetical protein
MKEGMPVRGFYKRAKIFGFVVLGIVIIIMGLVALDFYNG